MALYAIGDLHLSLNSDKSMEVFGPAWENYTERIRASLSQLTAEDVLVLVGDTSWGMSLEELTPNPIPRYHSAKDRNRQYYRSWHHQKPKPGDNS